MLHMYIVAAPSMVTAPPTAARHALILRFLVVLQPLLIIPAVPALWLYASSCERLAGSGPTTVVFTAAGDRQEANSRRPTTQVVGSDGHLQLLTCPLTVLDQRVRHTLRRQDGARGAVRAL